MAFDEVQFPANISRNARGGPRRKTQIAALANGDEERNASWLNSRRQYDVAYGVRNADALAAVVAFFEARNGMLYGFRFKDWADYKSSLPSVAVAATDQLLAYGDGTTAAFQLVKAYTSGARTYTRAITKPVAGTVRVALGGVLLTSGWTIDTTSGVLTFDVAPGTSVAVTAGFEFDVPVRFDTDMMDVVLDFERLGSITSIPLIEIRQRTSAIVAASPLLFGWADVFKDQTAFAGGANWTGWGTSTSQPAEVPLEFFMRTVLPTLAPIGATIILESPTGTMHLRGRMQPPPRSVLADWTLDLSDTIVERGKAGTYWGLIHLWGDVVESPSGSPPSVGVDAAIGATSLTLKNDADTTAFLTTVGPGSICQVRTNSTSLDYHPVESRETIFISSVAGRVLTLARPLTISVPVNNPLDYPGETVDPSTVTLLVGSLLASNAAAGANTVTLVNAAGINIGDWVYLSTSELPTPTGNQFAATIGVLLNPAEEFGDIIINEELHLVTGKSGNTLTLADPLGKNKLTAWNAACILIDPIENATVKGGKFVGQQDNTGVEAWEHQYIWARYCVNCTVSDGIFDKDGSRPLNVRRIGQAVRSDTGRGNTVTRLTIGQGGSIEPGEGYGVSLRRGERYSVVSYCDIEKCRHSIELWGTTDGCIVEFNTSRNDTSSGLDTHGSWNNGVIIRNNTVSNDGLLLSPDLGGLPDAIRIGNNKFIFDENIQVLDNTVTNYRGNAFSVVPGSRSVTVDGLICNDVDRVFGLTQNTRHPSLFSQNVTIRNVTADNVKDRLTEVSNVGGAASVKNLTLEDWSIGGSGVGTANVAGIINFRLFEVENLILRRVREEAITTQTFHYGWYLEDVTGVTFTDCFQKGGQRGVSLTRVTGVSGNIWIENLAATTKEVVRTVGTCSGAMTVTYKGFTPVVAATGVTVTLVAG